MASSKIVVQQIRCVPRDPIVAATIDIPELIILRRGEVKCVGFVYVSGDPYSLSFGMEWYISMANQMASVNALPPLDDLPTYQITPRVPFRGITELLGTVTFTTPEDTPYLELYPKIRIYQSVLFDSEVVATLEEPVGPPETQRRRRIQPQWER